VSIRWTIGVTSQITEGKGIDASVSWGLFEGNVLEYVQDLALLSCYEVFGA